MPLQPRADQSFTTTTLMVGFPQITFERLKSDGTFDTAVDIGIIADAALAKEVDIITLQDGSSGFLTDARKVVGRISPQFNVEVFSFKSTIAELVFGSSALVETVANAAATVVNDPFVVPSTNPTLTFASLAQANVLESSFVGTSVTCGTITAEAVGTGDGVLGATDGDFTLDFKPLVIGDVTSLTVGGVTQTVVSIEPSAGEVQVTVGTGATSGDLDFGTVPPSGAAIVATYTPSHAFANLTDYVVDPAAGRVRFLSVDGATDALKNSQPMFADYTFKQLAGVTLKPFVRPSVTGRVTINLLTENVGSNFIWTVPSADILLNDDDLTFGAEDFVRGSLTLGLNDAGGTARYGSFFLADETQAAA